MNPAGSTCSGEHRGYHHGNLREALVAAGVELARAGGPNAVVLRAASRQAGVSPNAAYRHFMNREELLAAVAQRCMTQLSLLMIDRVDRVATRDRVHTAEGKLGAIGLAYVDFARTEPGWFRTAFTSPRRPRDDVLRGALDELVGAGALTPERRVGVEYAVWSAVHGLSILLLDGPLRDLPDRDATQVISTALGAVCIAGQQRRPQYASPRPDLDPGGPSRLCRGETAHDGGEGIEPGPFLLTFRHDSQDLAAGLRVCQSFPHRVDLPRRVRHRFGAEQSRVMQTVNCGLELDPGALAGGDEPGIGV